MQPFETFCLVELLGLHIQLAITAAYPKYFHQPITVVIKKNLIACLRVGKDPLAASHFRTS